ncbi:hypothetical protein AciPR4_2263 [Terriglobus saanensis SP1PR4]|uniref:Uncharacterized protein n=1 Tax=Terriglobus saanensis (strain ATCC BAA-1853 / DSM 23119 / SP1PR4) TaxID=401053 RepID=E8UXA1_TERSS|nr:hypothetical protein AciPR4_2263 [Terriglobus saanensis SP1PR4]
MKNNWGLMLNTIKSGRGRRLFLMFTKHTEGSSEVQEKENPWSKLVLSILFLFAAVAILATLFGFFKHDLS